jgi:diguanylate cyclase (GGDEF)-like protein/PAS domain S-box-containing protein
MELLDCMKRGLAISGLAAFYVLVPVSGFILPDGLKPVSWLMVGVVTALVFGLKGGLAGAAASTGLALFYHWYSPVLSTNGLIIYLAAGVLASILVSLPIEHFRREQSQFLKEANRLEEQKNVLSEQEARYREFFSNHSDGIAYSKIIYDTSGHPSDYTFLEVNHAFERFTGLHRDSIQGLSRQSAIPGKADPFFDWVKHYETANAGKIVNYEAEYGNRSFSVTVYSPTLGYFYTILHDISEIKEYGDDYRNLVEKTRDFITRFDRNLNCLYTNTNMDYRNKKPMEVIFGQIGTGAHIPEAVQLEWQKKVLQVFRSKREETIDMKVNTILGAKYYECRIIPEFSQDGYVDSVICMNRDDTVFKSAEEDMKLTLDKLQELENIVNVSSIIAFLWHADERWSVEFISGNIDQFGYTQQDFTKGNMSFLDLVHPDDLERVLEEQQVYSKESVNEFSQEFRVRTKTGEEQLVKLDLWIRRSSDGTVTHYQGMITNVTNVIKIPKQVIESQKQYRDLFEAVNDIVFILDVRGTFVSVNREGESFYGVERDDLKKMNFLQLVPIDKRTEGQKILAEMTSGIKKEQEYIIEMLDIEGSRHQMHLNCKEVLEGGRLSIAVSARDNTEQIQVIEQVKYLSYHDKLTGLYNRTFFEEELERLQQNPVLPLSIIVGDVDGLKLTNDAFSHKKGDELLKRIADILKSSCSIEDSVIRVGGDEFAIILRETDEMVANNICSRIRNMCSQAAEDPVKPSIALGTSTMYDISITVEQVVREAEDRMNRSKLMESRSIRSSIISSLQKTLEERTYETKKHAERMQKLADKLGKQLNLAESEMDELNLLCVLHDIGKIGIPDNILMKSGRLTADEWEIMKKHTLIGFNIADASSDLKPIAKGILAHHENWDGTGYPHRLKEGEIPLISRIISVIDAYDAMINDRPYHKAISQIAAIIEIDRCAGTQFDPGIVEAFKKELLS